MSKVLNSSERTRLLKAFHAFKSDPSDYNLTRIEKAAKAASDTVYVTNALGDFAKKVGSIPRYSDFNALYDSLMDRAGNLGYLYPR